MELYEDAARFKAIAYERADPSRLYAHVSERYGVEIAETTQLDGGVHLVRAASGDPWVVRHFQRHRPVEAVAGDAEVLDLLAQHGYPAERCIDDPLSVLDGEAVLVTRYVEGKNLRGDTTTDTYREMGRLLAVLHQIPASVTADIFESVPRQPVGYGFGGEGQCHDGKRHGD